MLLLQEWLINVRRAMVTMHEDCDFIRNTANAILKLVFFSSCSADRFKQLSEWISSLIITPCLSAREFNVLFYGCPKPPSHIITWIILCIVGWIVSNSTSLCLGILVMFAIIRSENVLKKYFFASLGGLLKCGSPCSAEHVKTFLNSPLSESQWPSSLLNC